jgi:tetratricopeptide (TPR) repeat protein
MTHLHVGARHPAVSHRLLPSLQILIATVAFAAGGCASNNSPPALFGEYKKMLERQKAGMSLEDEALKKLPAMTAADYERLGDTYLQQGNLEMAFIQYDKASRMEPSQARIRYKVGLLFLKKGLPEEASKEFQEILKKDMTYALAYEGMGQAHLKMTNYVEAEKNLRQALTLSPELWQCHNFLGIVYDQQKRFDAAIAEYQASIALKPDQGFLFNNLGMSYYSKGDYERAIKAFMEAAKSGPAYNKIHNNLGLALAKLGRYQEALDAFKKGGDEAKAYNNLGVIYLVEKKYEEAISSFEKAIQLNPSYFVKASENLKIARKALSETTQISATMGKVGMPPREPAPDTNRLDSAPVLPTPDPKPSTTDRRSQAEHALQVTESALAVGPRDGDESTYTIQVHIFRTKARADRVAARYVERGVPAFSASVEGPEGEQWWRIFIGRFSTEAEAEAFGRKLSQKEGLADFLVVHRSSAGT